MQSRILIVYLFYLFHHIRKELHENKERKQIHICARFKTKKKEKTETNKLNDFINIIVVLYGTMMNHQQVLTKIAIVFAPRKP